MIKILVDSASDIDAKEAEELGVTLIPLSVRFGDEEYADGVDISHSQFFEKLIESDELPKTSQINEYRFDECFKRLTAEGDEVIAITLSSKLSGTYNSAVGAAKKYKGVYAVDSLNASLGERILCLYAIQLVKEGLTATQIVNTLNEKKNNIQLLAMLDTLKFLRKGGRIPSVVAITGELLSIKPVISIIKGEIKLVGKAMGSKKGNNLLTQLVEKCGGINFDLPFALAYSGLSDELLKKYITDSEKLWKGHTQSIPTYMIGSTIGTHIGPGAIAVAFFAK